MLIYNLIHLPENTENSENELIEVFFTPTDPVEYEDVFVYARITYPGNFKAYIATKGHGLSRSLMSKHNATHHFGIILADDLGETYELWVLLIDENTTLDSPLMTSKHYFFTVRENIYSPRLSNVYHTPENPTHNDTITFHATMYSTRKIRYSVMLNYYFRSPSHWGNISFDLVNYKSGLKFEYTHEPERVNTTITYSVSVWHNFSSDEKLRSKDCIINITA